MPLSQTVSEWEETWTGNSGCVVLSLDPESRDWEEVLTREVRLSVCLSHFGVSEWEETLTGKSGLRFFLSHDPESRDWEEV